MSANYDWAHLDSAVNPQTNVLKYASVKHLFKKVAFDVYKQDGSARLWELRTEDGEDYLIALYDDGNTDIVIESTEDQDWTAVADSEGENVTLSYQNTPIARFASTEYQYTADTAEKFAKFIEKKAENPKFINDLLDTMPSQKKEAVLKMLREGVI